MARGRANKRLPKAVLPSAGLCFLWLVAGCGGGGGDPRAAASATATATFTRAQTATATPSTALTATRTPTTAEPTATATALQATPTSTPVTEVPTSTMTATETATPEPTATPTATPLTGPIVSAFGVADTSGTFDDSVGMDDQGRAVFAHRSPTGFIIFVEGRPGPSRLPVGSTRFNYKPNDPAAQPDVQIVSSTDLGTATQAVCDNAFPVRGGVPAIDPPRFGIESAVSDALNDFGCRFKLFAETDFACTQDSRGNFVFSSASSSNQFCTLVDDALTFPIGETVLTARLRDTAGNAGPSAQIVIRISGAR